VQSKGVAATVKHFIANDSEFERNTISSEVDERTLREIYLPPFEAAVKEAGTWALMSSYNRVNGAYVNDRPDLINELLKGEWGFDGLVMSDWFATHSTAAAMNGGLDLEMPGPTQFRGQKLVDAVRAGEVPAEAVRESARRVLRLIDRVGAFDDPAIP
jgi:beta-glucosidase